jgi:membrane protein
VANRDPSKPPASRTPLDRLEALGDHLVGRADAFSERHPVMRRTWLVGVSVVTSQTAQAASAMAFDLFLATIPLLALSGWLFARVLHSSDAVISATSSLLDLTPHHVHELVLTHLGQFSGGAVAPLVLLGALWVASSAFHTSMTLFEVVAGAESRPWWKKRALSLLCVIVALLAIASGASAAVVLAGGPSALLAFFFSTDEAFGATLNGSLLLALALLLATGLMAAFYRISVSRPNVRRRIWPGAFAAVFAGGSASLMFGYYAYHLARYALFYGSLAAVAVTLAWLWLLCFTSLIGAELNFQLENSAFQPASGTGVPTHTPQPSGSSTDA